MEYPIKKYLANMRLMFIAIAFFSIANTAHCDTTGRAISLTCKEHARLVALTAKAEFAVLNDEGAPLKLSRGSRLTAQEIRIRYKLLNILLVSVIKEISEFASLDIRSELGQIQSKLYKLVLMESRGKYSQKVNFQIQSVTKDIAEHLSDLTNSVFIRCTSPQHSVNSVDNSCDLELPSDLLIKETVLVQEASLSKSSAIQSKGFDSCVELVEAGSSADLKSESDMDPCPVLPILPILKDEIGALKISEEIAPSCPPPPPPPPMSDSSNSGYEMLFKLLDSFKCGQMFIKPFQNPSLFDSLGNPILFNEFQIPDPFRYDPWNKWYFDGQTPGRSHSGKIKRGVPERVEEVLQSIETFKSWLVILAEDNALMDGSKQTKMVINFLLKHTKAIAYFEKKLERDFVISDLDIGLRAQIAKAEMSLSNIEMEARKFLAFKSEIEGKLKSCDLNKYLAEVEVQAGHSTRIEYGDSLDKPSLHDLLKANDFYKKRQAISLAAEEAEIARRFEEFQKSRANQP